MKSGAQIRHANGSGISGVCERGTQVQPLAQAQWGRVGLGCVKAPAGHSQQHRAAPHAGGEMQAGLSRKSNGNFDYENW